MHIAAKVGIAVAAAGATGYGMVKLNERANDLEVTKHAKLDEAVAEQSAVWDSWKPKLDAEFPGGKLATPADHARLETFLREHPEPSWIKVEHEDYTRLRLSVDERIVDPDLLPEAEREKGIGYGFIGGIGAMAMGGAALLGGFAGGGKGLASAAFIAGGAAMAAVGAGLTTVLVNDIRRGTNMDGYHALLDDVRPHLG